LNTFVRTEVFDAWLRARKDSKARARIVQRIESAQAGNFGNCEPVGHGVSEMRIHFGAGYRVYYTRIGETIYLLLAGGAKSTQARDVRRHRNDAQREASTMKSIKTRSRSLKSLGVKPFDAADYLTDDEAVAEYLTAALEDPDPDMFLIAIKNVARARGMAQLAKDTGLGRESLYKALAPGAKPRYDTILKVTRALGIRLHAEAAQ
jgi:probable addiction module antidote protein/putative addiction module killer protein